MPVFLEVLKTKDIQYTDGLAKMSGVTVRFVYSQIDLVDQPDEHSSIESLDECIPHIYSTLRVHVCGDTFSTRNDAAHGKCTAKAVDIHL